MVIANKPNSVYCGDYLSADMVAIVLISGPGIGCQTKLDLLIKGQVSVLLGQPDKSLQTLR